MRPRSERQLDVCDLGDDPRDGIADEDAGRMGRGGDGKGELEALGTSTEEGRTHDCSLMMPSRIEDLMPSLICGDCFFHAAPFFFVICFLSSTAASCLTDRS